MNILSAEQFSTEQIETIFANADELKASLKNHSKRKLLADRYKGKQLATLFYQPSTRTRLSFETAALKLGLGVVSTENALGSSSAIKGEILEDTIKVLNQYDIDIIVLRFSDVGGAKRAAKVSRVPLINAGDGPGEHPTQALLDAYTIKESHGRLDNLKVVMGGDLRYGRTVRSLSHVLSKYEGNQITFVSVPELQVSDDIKKFLNGKVNTVETGDMAEAFADADVVYWTRLQKENLKNPEAVPNNGFIINKEILKHLPQKAIIMHPLPRVDEITDEVDDDVRAIYFKEAGNGLYIRMALIDMILSGMLS